MENFPKMVEDLRAAFNTGRTKNIEWRKSQLKAVERMLKENEKVFTDALKSDLNKPLMESVIFEVDFAHNEIISLLRNIDTWTKDIICDKAPLTLLDTPLIHPEPYGVVMNISTWNYPLLMCLSPILPAIAAGNCVVLKPSELAPATAKALDELIPRYMDTSCVQVVCGGVAETTALLQERFDYIFYTGSTQVGKIVREAANKFLTPVTLELGGKSPVYVDDSGDLETMMKRLMWGKCSNAGQICVAPDYVLCSKATEKKMIPIMKRLLSEWHSDKPEMSKDFCRIINNRHFDRLKNILQNTEGNIEIGGRSDPDTKFMEVTVLTGVGIEDSTMKEEIFGPILPIINVESVEQAITMINSREKPLALYVFTDRENVMNMFKTRTSSGGIVINDIALHLSVEELPFGGVGSSGMGSYHGKFGFDTFTHHKAVLKKDLGWLGEKMGEIRYPPYQENLLSTIRYLAKNRQLPGFGWMKHVGLVGIGAAIGYACSFIH